MQTLTNSIESAYYWQPQSTDSLAHVEHDALASIADLIEPLDELNEYAQMLEADDQYTLDDLAEYLRTNWHDLKRCVTRASLWRMQSFADSHSFEM